MSTDLPQIGTLRDRVQLLRKDTNAAPDGGHLTVFVPLATVWARVHASSARLNESADARATRATHSVVMRHRSDLSAGDRMTWRARALEVLSVEDLNGKRAFIVCACAETAIAG